MFAAENTNLSSPTVSKTVKKNTLTTEIVATLLSNTITAILVNLSVATLTYLTIPSPSAGWFWVIIGVSLLRLLPHLFLRLQPSASNRPQLLYTLVLMTIFLQGAAWGYGFVALYENAIDLHKFYLIAIICGMIGGSVLTLTPSQLAFTLFSLPSVVPLVVTLLLASEKTYNRAGIMGVIFLIAVMIASRKISATNLDLIISKNQLKLASHELLNHKNRLELLVEERTAKLKESKEKYRQLIEEINDAIFEVDSSGILTYVSPAITRITGHHPEDLLGVNFTELVFQDDLQEVQERFPLVMSGELSPSEHRMLNTANQPYWVRTSSRPILHDGHPIGLRGILTDINAEKQSEGEKVTLLNKFHESQRLESLGTLAGGIAHDFNNLIMAILGHINILQLKVKPPDPNAQHLDAIEKQIQSASHLTAQLLGTARGGKYNPQPTDLNTLIETSATLFSRTKKEIQFTIHLAPAPFIADVDKPQLEQVLLNLFVNAWQAMPHGGTLEITTSTVKLGARYCKPYNVVAGRYALISVADSGVGMDELTLQKIFNPFFTTKEKERGTGLGLSSAHGIIKNHGGFITVSSVVNFGSTFNIYLPLSDKKPAQETDTSVAATSGSETILLVDDEQIVVEVTQEVLKSLGYKVVTALGGLQAIEIIKESNERIDMVILDMIMPDLDGGKTFDLIQQLAPSIPIILSSGYAQDGKASEIMQRGCSAFIQKPYKVIELSKKIRTVLDNKGQ